MQNPQTLDRYDSQRSRLPTLKGNNAHHNSSVDVISGLVQLRQQLDELGMTRFSSAIGAVRDIVSTITRDRDNENAFEEIYDLCEQLDVLLIQPLKEGKATNMVENIVEITRDLEDIVTKYHKEFAGLHHYPELLEKVPINFLESLAHLLYQSLDIAKSNVPEELYRVVEVMESTGQDFRDTSRSVQHINAQTTDIQQMADSSHRDSTLSGGTFASAPSLVHLDLSGKIDHGKRIALGNFSDVWHGTFVTDAGNVEVAIKALRVKQSRNQTAGEDRLSKRFYREVLLWARLRHPNITPLLGYAMDPDGVPCLVSPWFPNGNLIEYLQSHPNANRLSLASDVTKALRYLHSIPVVHGDLKGENILVNSNGSACLCDFGMSQFLDEALRITGFTTSTANTGGTNRYLAPELLDEVPKTTESDMWAFGCVIMQTLTDQLPYQQLNRPSALVLAITRGEPPYNQNSDFIRDSLWSCLTKCWSTDPEERPTISDLARHLYLNNS